MPLRLGLPITSHCGHREGARYSGIYPRRKVLVRATFDVLRSLRSASTNRLSPDSEKSINYSRIYSTQPAPGIRTNARPTKARRMISMHEAVALSLKNKFNFLRFMQQMRYIHSTHASSSSSPLAPCITTSLFHSRLKVYLFHTSFHDRLLVPCCGLSSRT